MDWDLTPFFPTFRGPEMLKFSSDLEKRIKIATKAAGELGKPTSRNLKDWETVFNELEEINRRSSHLGVYVGCLCAADATNEEYEAEQAALSLLYSNIRILANQLSAKMRSASESVVEQLTARKALKGAEYHIERFHQLSQKRMSVDEEDLAAKLAVDGISAWSRLYDTLSGNLEFEMTYPDGKTQTLPISQCRSLMSHPDREIRRAAFEGGNETWSREANTLKAALNAISGTRLTLDRERGVRHFLDNALFDAGITGKSLDAMFEAIDDSLKRSRQILKFKAKRLGLNAISWYDLEASIPQKTEEDPIDWETAKGWVSRAFHRGYPRLGEFFDRICEENWIDWSQRPGKRPGGFCATSDFNGESRIFMTYNECAHDIMTLAHEVGHAYHSYILKDSRPFAKGYPMTLAESASTFAELILTEGLQADNGVDPRIKLQLADEELNHSSAFLLDIPVRFHFEKALYERRATGELSVTELNNLMIETQRNIFGNSLETGEENPYFWASKLHFYISGISFYNFPYTFGYLMSRALFRLYKEEGESFFARYEDYLLMSGSMSCEQVAKRSLGQNIRKPEFWAEAIGTIEGTLSRTRRLLKKVE